MDKKLKEFYVAQQLRHMRETQYTCLGVDDDGHRYYESKIMVHNYEDKIFFKKFFDDIKKYNLIRSTPFEFERFWDKEYRVIYSITPRGRELIELSRSLEKL